MSIARLFGSIAGRDDALTLRSSSGAIAIVASWKAALSSPHFEVVLDSDDTAHHRVAFVLTGDRGEAKGLLRFCDVVGIPRDAEDETVEAPPGLVSCGQIAVQDAAGSTETIGLFKSAPVDRRRLMQDAPIDIDEPEDLDAREAWFKKRHGRDG